MYSYPNTGTGIIIKQYTISGSRAERKKGVRIHPPPPPPASRFRAGGDSGMDLLFGQNGQKMCAPPKKINNKDNNKQVLYAYGDHQRQ